MWALPLLLLPSFAPLPRQDSDADAAKLIEIARAAIVAEVSGKPNPPDSADSPAKPVFVTIERGGKILGCRGSLSPRSTTLGQEVSLAAASAAAHDPRYRPMRPSDLNGFLVTVTIVDRLETISNISGLEPSEGLVLTSGPKTGVVLPWEGKDPTLRLSWAYKKAGVSAGSSVTLQKLIARRWRG